MHGFTKALIFLYSERMQNAILYKSHLKLEFPARVL